MSPTATEKVCARCGPPAQPADAFRKSRSARDGLQSWCKACHRAYKKTPVGKELRRRYLQGAAGRAATKRANATDATRARKRVYKTTSPGKATNHRYNTSTKGRAATRRYKMTAKGVAAEKRYLAGSAGRETMRRASFRYLKSPRGQARLARRRDDPRYRALQRELGVRWNEANREKRRAHLAVRRAVVSGRLAKPSECERCPRTGVRLDAHHHNGYENALDVIWLCGSCHRLAHTRGEQAVGADA